MQFEKRSDVPVPPAESAAPGNYLKVALRGLEVGESLYAPFSCGLKPSSILATVSSARSLRDVGHLLSPQERERQPRLMGFTSRREGEGYRVWRTE